MNASYFSLYVVDWCIGCIGCLRCGGAIAGSVFRMLPARNNRRIKLSGLLTSDDSDKTEGLDTTEGTSEPFDTFENTVVEGLDPTEGIETSDKTVLEGLDPI